MKAFAIKEVNQLTELEIDKPVLGVNDVLIDVYYLGLCGSDLSAYKGLMPLVTFPRIPGHEISGKIAAIGDKVPKGYELGDNVTVLPYTNCGVCPACRIGRTNTCEFNQTLGVQRDGALTKQISVPYEKVFVSKILSLEELVLIEPLSVGYHAANRAQINETDTVVLFGCGTIGMGALLATLKKGATLVAVDIDDTKLETARKFGAQYTLNSLKEDIKAEIAKITNNEGATVAIEAAGIPATFVLALEVIAFAGRIATIGYSKTDVSINTQLIVKKELNVFGSRNALHVFPSVIKMFEQKEKPYTDFITMIFPFENTEEAFKYWTENTGSVTKILIKVK